MIKTNLPDGSCTQAGELKGKTTKIKPRLWGTVCWTEGVFQLWRLMTLKRGDEDVLISWHTWVSQRKYDEEPVWRTWGSAADENTDSWSKTCVSESRCEVYLLINSSVFRLCRCPNAHVSMKTVPLKCLWATIWTLTDRKQFVCFVFSEDISCSLTRL